MGGMTLRRVMLVGAGVFCALAAAVPARAGATPVLSELAGSPFSTGQGSNDFGVAFSRDGLIATSDFGTGSVSLFSVSAGLVAQVPGSPFAAGSLPWGIAFSPSGQLLAVVNQGAATVSVYQADRSGLVPVRGSPFSGTGSFPEAVAFSADGRLLATSSVNWGGGQLGLFNVGDDGELLPVAGSPFTIAAGESPGLAFSPTGDLLAVASENPPASTVSLYQASSGGLEALGTYSTGTNADPADVAFSSDGRLLAVSNANNSTIALYSVEQDELVPVPGSPFSTGIQFNPGSLSFSPDGQYLAVDNSSSAMSPLNDGIFVFAVGPGGLTPAAGSPFPTSPVNEGPTAVAFSPDGQYLASADIFGYMSLFGVNTSPVTGGGGGGPGVLEGSTAAVSRVSARGTTVTVRVVCRGAAGNICSLRLTLRATETLRAATVRGRTTSKRTRTRVVVVGRARVAIAAGHSQLVRVTLNAAGRRLLLSTRRLTATLSVVQVDHSGVVARETVTLRRKKHPEFTG